MQLLQAVNTVLRSTGESPVAAVNSSHPQIATILDFITNASEVLQSRPWWFNTFERDYAVSGSGEYPVPPDVTYLAPKYPSQGYVLLNGYLCDSRTGLRVTADPVTGTPIQTKVRVYIDPVTNFTQFPSTFAQYLAAVAALEYAADYDADQMQLTKLATRVKATKTMVEADNIRLAKLNFFETGTVGMALARNFGSRYWRYI